MYSLPQATASASGQAQATAVAEAATQTYAAAFAALQQCTQAPPPTATPAPSTANLQCIILPVDGGGGQRVDKCRHRANFTCMHTHAWCAHPQPTLLLPSDHCSRRTPTWTAM